MADQLRVVTVMDAAQLAREAYKLRVLKKMSQREVAELLVEKGLYESMSKQSVARAEDEAVTTGDKLYELRVTIVEVLGNKKLRGPVWVVEDEPA